jgi:multiple sugar transport system permease protein
LIPVGITQVNDAFGVAYARIMSAALPAAMPVAVACLIFQRRSSVGKCARGG